MNLAERLLETQPRKFAMWPSVLKLLRLRVRIWWNAFRRSKLRSKIGTGVVVLLALGGMGLLFFLSSALLRFLQSPQLAEYLDPAQFLAMIPGLVLTMAFVMILLTNFGVLLQALYLSRDMDFLISTPLPMRAVFLSKMLEAILPNFALICVFTLPVLFGLGSSRGYSPVYYPALLLVLAMLALAAGGLASILVMGVVRLVPARRVAEVLGFLVATSSILCGQSANLMNAMGVEGDDIGNALGMFTRMEMPWSPLSWAGQGLDALGQGRWLAGLGLTLPVLLLAGAVFAGALYLAEQLYYTGWSSMQGSFRKKRPTRAPAAGGQRAGLGMLFSRLLPRPVWAVMVKDALLLRRDPRNLSQLITPIILGVVMLFTTQGRRGSSRMGSLDQLGLQNMEVYGMLVLAVFIGWMLMFYLATMAFSREGRNYWFLKAAPVRTWHLLAAKFLVAFLPSLAFGLAYLLVGFFFRNIAWEHFPYTALVLSMTTAGATGISLAFGVAAANLEWDSPQRQRLRGSAGCLVFPAVLAFEALALALFIMPPILWQVWRLANPLLSYGLGGLLGTGAALLGVFLPLFFVAGRVPRMGEND